MRNRYRTALEIAELADALRDADVKLGPMTVTEVRRAIEAPARALGVLFQDGLAEEILREPYRATKRVASSRIHSRGPMG